MKRLPMKLALIAGFVCFTGMQVSAQVGVRKASEQTSVSKYKTIEYDELTTWVFEFMYKSFEVRKNDIKEIRVLNDGEFLISMNRSFNTFTINKPLKMDDGKLENIAIKRNVRLENGRKTASNPAKSKRKGPMKMANREVDYQEIPLNIREYLYKELQADENKVEKVIFLGGDKYKITLKKSHNQFVITEKHPYRISLNIPS